jgi:DNA-binding MarR family transcriptional regulator
MATRDTGIIRHRPHETLAIRITKMTKPISTKGLASLFEQTARLIHTSGHVHGLYPAQWAALRYFSEAPPRNRTMADLARFQNIRLTPVGRTVRTLVDKGLLERRPNPRSKKADLIYLTAEGKAVLRRDPKMVLAEVLTEMEEARRLELNAILQHTLQGLLQRYGGVVDEPEEEEELEDEEGGEAEGEASEASEAKE